MTITMDDSMTRRVALAMRKNRFERTGRKAAFDAGTPLSDNEIDDARAAIEAMKIPTFAMVEAPAGLEIDPGTADDVWQSMIDKALES